VNLRLAHAVHTNVLYRTGLFGGELAKQGIAACKSRVLAKPQVSPLIDG
jgi:hypothetical protein